MFELASNKQKKFVRFTFGTVKDYGQKYKNLYSKFLHEFETFLYRMKGPRF